MSYEHDPHPHPIRFQNVGSSADKEAHKVQFAARRSNMQRSDAQLRAGAAAGGGNEAAARQLMPARQLTSRGRSLTQRASAAATSEGGDEANPIHPSDFLQSLALVLPCRKKERTLSSISTGTPWSRSISATRVSPYCEVLCSGVSCSCARRATSPLISFPHKRG